MWTRVALFSVLLMGCSAGDEVATGVDDLQAKADDEWFYNGPMPVLEQPAITVSLAGNTAHLSGLVPVNAAVPDLPNAMTSSVNGRTRIDVVYPIATAAIAKNNSKPGAYSFYEAMPYRPNGSAWTPSLGTHFVTWGGFPFVAYNNGIAFHGPITSTTANGTSVWLLKRGDVSSGCNRMNGEHVIELAHAIGVDMKKAYQPNATFVPKTTAKVTVISGYDQYDGKYIDVDYPTDVGVTRPGKIYGDANVVMFGSWVASELPNGADLPGNLKWEGGVSGQYYVFADHALENAVCSVAKADLPKVRTWLASRGGEVPADFCAKKACYLNAVRSGTKPGC